MEMWLGTRLDWSPKDALNEMASTTPLARYGSIRYLLGIAAKNGFDINQMNAVTAFLHSIHRPTRGI